MSHTLTALISFTVGLILGLWLRGFSKAVDEGSDFDKNFELLKKKDSGKIFGIKDI